MSSALIIGGSGALGRAFINHFNSLNYKTLSVDLFENPAASLNFTPESVLAASIGQVNLIVNTAGGWAGGDASDPEFPEKCENMWQMNVKSSILAAQLAASHLKPQGGLLVFVGAKAVATHATPDMLAYAMAKSAVASLANNLAAAQGSTHSVTLLLPEVLDTEANRKAMPNADISKWTPVDVIAARVAEMTLQPRDEINGKSWTIVTRSCKTEFKSI